MADRRAGGRAGGEERRSRPSLPRLAQRPEDEGRRARGADADDEVPLARPDAANRRRARRGVVLGSLDGAPERPGPAGDERHDPGRGDAEGGRALGGVEAPSRPEVPAPA